MNTTIMAMIFPLLTMIVQPKTEQTWDDFYNDYWQKQCEACPYEVCVRHNKGTDSPLYKFWANRDNED